MSRGEKSDSIPIDLIIEILSNLPAKSIARFSCVSKPWRSMLARPYFKDLFFTRSSTRPRLLFTVQQDRYDVWFFSSSQPHPYEKSSSLVVTADFHTKLPKDTYLTCSHAFGLVYFCGRKGMVICKPSTGQLALLPIEERMNSRLFLGFDPVDNQFKVLSIDFSKSVLILTLGDNSWREISCPLNRLSTCGLPEGICITGVLYYFATQNNGRHLIVCFDVRSEEFKFIYKDFFKREKKTYTSFILDRDNIKLINYMGKLGVITLEYGYNPSDRNKSKGRRSALKLCMSVIKDVGNPNSEWSEHVYTFWNQVAGGYVSVVGVTATGDIVLSMEDASKQLYVIYLNIERKTLQRVEFRTANHEVFEKCSSKLLLSVDHVEDLSFFKATTALHQTSSRMKLYVRGY